MKRHEVIAPEALGAPKGFSQGILAQPGRLLFVAGQIGWDSEERIVSEEFAAQFGKALENVMAVVEAAGGAAHDICRMTIYVTDKVEYNAALRDIGGHYRRLVGRHYPAMALLQVADLLEPGAKVEIEATAVIPEEQA